MDEQIRKYLENELTLKERVVFLRALESDKALKKELIGYLHLRTLIRFLPQTADPADGKSSFQAFIWDKRKIVLRKVMREALKYAAIALFLIGGTWMFFTHQQESEEVVMNSLYVPPGQRACLSLHDGTKVWLNAQSTLEYPARFTKKERRVTLTGEAFFDVSPTKEHPFIVSTGQLEMKVLGTQFNVYSYADAGYVCASLLEGSLKVYRQGMETKSVTLKPNEEIYYNGGEMKANPLKNANNFLWKDGIYNFEKETLAEIIQKLERYYDVRIEVKDPSILALRYTAKFRQRDGLDEILRQIQKTHRFKIKKDTNNNIITLL
ncbi:MAG: DUF4974 domain-containing protein [Tannerella sp.]|jgi:ferric-dicitrate binding protein FerR (iron transport regulator)|nr:DUF4974 domain-containing protein [Tannerella sp.]